MGFCKSLLQMALLGLRPVAELLAFSALIYGCWLLLPAAGWIAGGGLVLFDLAHGNRKQTNAAG